MFNKITLIFVLLFLFQMPVMGMEIDEDSNTSLKLRQKPTKEVGSSFCCCFTLCFKKTKIDTEESSIQDELDQEQNQNRVAVTSAIVPVDFIEEESEERYFKEEKADNSSDSSQSEHTLYRPRTSSYQIVPVSEVDLFSESVASNDDEFLHYDYNNHCDYDNNNYLTKIANTLLNGNLDSCNIGNCGKFKCKSDDIFTFEVPDGTKWCAKIKDGKLVKFEAELPLPDDKTSFEEDENHSEYPGALVHPMGTYKIFLVPAEEFS